MIRLWLAEGGIFVAEFAVPAPALWWELGFPLTVFLDQVLQEFRVLAGEVVLFADVL